MQHHAFIKSLDHQNYLPAIQAGLKFTWIRTTRFIQLTDLH